MLIVEQGIRSDQLAAIVAGYLKAGQRTLHPGGNRLGADIVDQNVQRVTNPCAIRILEIGRGQGLVDFGQDGWMIFQIMHRLDQPEITGGAGDDQIARLLLALFLGQGEVAGAQRERFQLADRHVGRGAATVPVVQFRQVQTQLAKDGEQRFLVSATGALERTARIVEVVHGCTSRDFISIMCSVSSAFMMPASLRVSLIASRLSPIRPLSMRRSPSPAILSILNGLVLR